MARGELHVQLYIHYADDEKFEGVSRSARLLYVDALCMSKALLNDGELSLAKVHKLMLPESKRAAVKAADELVRAGLWRLDEDRQVYVIAGWLKRNRSRSQVHQDRREAEENALRGNHKRWHVERGHVDPQCPLCAAGESHEQVTSAKKSEVSQKKSRVFLENPEESPVEPSEKSRVSSDTHSDPHSSDAMHPYQNGSGTRSGTRSGQRIGGESPETETETETEIRPPVAPRSSATPAPARPDPPAGNPGPAERLVTRWVQDCNRRPPSRVVDAVGREVAEMLRDGVQPDDIRRGLELWQDRGLNPKTLPSVVNQLMNARPANVVALPDRANGARPSTTDQRVGVALELAARYAQEDNP